MPCPSASRPISTAMASAVCMLAADQDEEYVYYHSSKGSTVVTVWLTLQVRSDLEAGQKVVGVGSCGLDYLAVVARYPEPDTKLRTENLEVSLPQYWPKQNLPAVLRSTSCKLSVCDAAMWRGRCYYNKMMEAELSR